MITNWKSFLELEMYLSPEDENRVRFLMGLVPDRESDGDARLAKRIALSSSMDEFMLYWMIHKQEGNVYLGDTGYGNYREFSHAKYDPEKDPQYEVRSAPNFRCDLILDDITRMTLFESSDKYGGTIQQSVILAFRIHAFRMKLKEKGSPILWMANGPQGIMPVALSSASLASILAKRFR